MNATQLKWAVLDPQWRARWLAGNTRVPPPPRTPAGEFPVQGRGFHLLVDRFTDWLAKGQGASGTGEPRDADGLWQALYDRFAEKELSALAAKGKLQSAHHLSSCLQVFCARLAELRESITDFGGWQDLFLGNELALGGIELAPGLAVTSQVDAVRADPRHGVAVVDYKLSRGGETRHDLVQLAIYARLLKLSRPGLAFTGLLEYYDPGLTVIEAAPAELDDLFDTLVQPVIDQLAGASLPPRGRPAPVAPPESNPPATVVLPRPDPPAAIDLSKKIEATFAAFKLEVAVAGKIEAPQLVRYQVRPGPGVKVVSLVNRAQDLQVALSLPMPPRIEPSQGFVSIDIPKHRQDVVPWQEAMDDARFRAEASRVAFPVGKDVDGRMIICDFADPNTCHALVGGTSGSGKSEFLKALVASLIARNTPRTLRLALIDPKILTFGELKDSPHLLRPIIGNLDGALACLEEAVEDMERRYARLADTGVANLAQYIQAGNQDLPYHVLIFDEFADLILAGKDERKRFENLVSRLAAKGRAAGMHLVLATQRPDRNIVTGPIKANLPLRICLKVTNAVNSQIILDEPGGESLVGRGDLLCDRGKGTERAQAPFVEAGALQALLSIRSR